MYPLLTFLIVLCGESWARELDLGVSLPSRRKKQQSGLGEAVCLLVCDSV